MPNLSVERLRILWQRWQHPPNDVLRDNEDISQRFQKVLNIVKELESLSVEIEEGRGKVNSISTGLTFGKFGPRHDDCLVASGPGCFDRVKQRLPPPHQDFHTDYWYLIAGWGNDDKPREDFRIISNTILNNNDDGSLSVGAISSRPNQNFASNNYFFQIAKFLKESKDRTNNFDVLIEESQLVLTWLEQLDPNGDANHAFDNSKKALRNRFPLKFLWMWANRETCIPVLSLKHMRDLQPLITQLDPAHVNFDPVNSDFDVFTQKWPDISHRLCEKVTK